MDLDKKIKIVLERVKFSKGRFRKYIGTIGEIVVREVLRKRGFEVWLVTAYFPEGMHKRIGGRLINVLQWIHKDLTDPLFEPEEKRIKEVKSFLGNRLKDFSRYMEKLGVIGKREYLYTHPPSELA